MTQKSDTITISRADFLKIAERVVDGIGDNLNTEAYVPFAEDCSYVIAELEEELFGKES